MSPFVGSGVTMTACFPRVSGDEPGISSMIGSVKSFSLRERG